VTFDITITNKGTGAGALVITNPTGITISGTWVGLGREQVVTGVQFMALGSNATTAFFFLKYDATTLIATNAVFRGSVSGFF